MAHANAYTPGSEAPTLYCPQCGQAMRVALEHLQMSVACPHCRQTLDPWRMVQVAGAQPSPPPPPPFALRGPVQAAPAVYSHRTKLAAGLLGILLGGLGAHRFYLGFIGIGILQLVFTAITCGGAALWGFVEGILCLTGHMRDVDGLPLRD